MDTALLVAHDHSLPVTRIFVGGWERVRVPEAAVTFGTGPLSAARALGVAYPSALLDWSEALIPGREAALIGRRTPGEVLETLVEAALLLGDADPHTHWTVRRRHSIGPAAANETVRTLLWFLTELARESFTSFWHLLPGFSSERNAGMRAGRQGPRAVGKRGFGCGVRLFV
jgi:hypothetical protein